MQAIINTEACERNSKSEICGARGGSEAVDEELFLSETRFGRGRHSGTGDAAPSSTLHNKTSATST